MRGVSEPSSIRERLPAGAVVAGSLKDAQVELEGGAVEVVDGEFLKLLPEIQARPRVAHSRLGSGGDIFARIARGGDLCDALEEADVFGQGAARGNVGDGAQQTAVKVRAQLHFVRRLPMAAAVGCAEDGDLGAGAEIDRGAITGR